VSCNYDSYKTSRDESINEDDDTIEDADEIDALLNEVERISKFIY
jgi:hypothetical protein